MAGILDGIRVVELGIYAVGPWAAKHLGAMGADVIKLEPVEGEGSHYIEPFLNGTAALYISANLNKRNVTLDLKKKDQHAYALEIIKNADVFIENMRPGTIDRLGLGYDKISKLNPGIIFASASAYGASGPMASEAGADPFVQAFCGWCSVTGEKGTEGEILRYMAHLDISTACVLTEAILHALLARERTGRGKKIELSMLAVAASNSDELGWPNTSRPDGSRCRTAAWAPFPARIRRFSVGKESMWPFQWCPRGSGSHFA